MIKKQGWILFRYLLDTTTQEICCCIFGLKENGTKNYTKRKKGNNKARAKHREHDGKKYRVIRGRKKGTTDEWEDQAFRYKKDVWTAGNAKTHCKDHDGSFEAAEESVQMESVESKEKEISPMSLAEEPKKDLVGNVYKEILDPSKSKPQIDKEQETESGKKALDLAGMNETYEKAVKELRKAFEELMKVIRRFKL